MTEEHRYTPGGISLEDRLKAMDEKLDQILDGAAQVDKRLAVVESKLDLHDKILMGVCGTVGISVVAAVMTAVIK